MSLSEEVIEQNQQKFETELLGKPLDQLEEGEGSPLSEFLKRFEQRLAECPASASTDLHNCVVGGLVDHSLRVLRNARRVVKFSPQICQGLDPKAVTLACLLHDIGKLGTTTEERFVLNVDSYKQRRGWLYQYNPVCPVMPIPFASLALLMEHGILLPAEVIRAFAEIESIQKSGHLYELSPLAFVLQTAKITAVMEEKAMDSQA